MVPNQPAMHCVCFGFNCLWICSRMFNFKAQVNFIFCIPHIDHGSLLLKSQKNVLAHGWCWWKFCLATVHCPEQNANKWRLNLGNFQQTFFCFFCPFRFHHFKMWSKFAEAHHHPCFTTNPASVFLLGPAAAASVLLSPADAASVLLSPADAASVLLSPADAASVLLGPAAAASVLLGPADAASVLLSPADAASVLLGPAAVASVFLGPADAASVLLGPLWAGRHVLHVSSRLQLFSLVSGVKSLCQFYQLSFKLFFAAWWLQVSYVSCLTCLITIFNSKVPFSVLLKGNVK